MKVTSIDHNDNATQKGKPVETAATRIEESDLFVEELEQVIAPKLSANHNETMVSDESRKRTKDSEVSDRRNFLKVAGAGLVAASVPSIASGAMAGTQTKGEDEATSRSGSVFMYGCGWNRALPGVFGEVCLAFDARAELGGTGVGTFRDDVHPEINSQFEINSATRQGDEYTFDGVITASRSRDLIGMQVRLVAESLGNGRGRATITVESPDTNLVVIAIIAVLMGLLLPAVQ
jgi:hypothetical protein